MSILTVDRDHDIRQDKLLTAFIVSIVVHFLLFIFFSQLAPLYRTPGIIKKKYEVLLLGKAEPDAKGDELTKDKVNEKKKEEALKVKEEPLVEPSPPPSPPSPPVEEILEAEPPPSPIAEPIPEPVVVKPEPVEKAITSKPAPVKARPVEKKAEKTVYSSAAEDMKKEEQSKSASETTGGAKTTKKAGAPVPAGQSYVELIKALVTRNLKYPPAAKINRIEGEVTVSFLISGDGETLDVNIKRSSGYPILDDGALRAIRKSEPFPAFEGTENVVIVYMGDEQYASVSIKIGFNLDYITMGAE